MTKRNKTDIMDLSGEKEFNIGESGTIIFTKKELINVIEKTFPDKHGSIAVLTFTKARNYETGEGTVMQSVTFGKLLEV